MKGGCEKRHPKVQEAVRVVGAWETCEVLNCKAPHVMNMLAGRAQPTPEELVLLQAAIDRAEAQLDQTVKEVVAARCPKCNGPRWSEGCPKTHCCCLACHGKVLLNAKPIWDLEYFCDCLDGRHFLCLDCPNRPKESAIEQV